MYNTPQQLSIFDPSLSTQFFDEFSGCSTQTGTVTNSIVSSNFVSIIAGAGANVSNADAADPQSFGCIRMDTGNTAAGIASLHDLAGIFLNQGTIDVTWRAMIPVLSSGADRFAARLGIFDFLTFAEGGGSDGVYFHYDDGSSSTFIAKTNNNGAVTGINTGVIVNANQWYKLRIVISGGVCNFYINNALVASISAALTPVRINLRAAILKSIGLTLCSIFVDYCNFQQIFSVAR